MSPQQQAVASAVQFVEKVNRIILFPIMTLLMAVAFLVFLYGCAQFIMNADNETARADGRKHILWGLIGLVIMVSAVVIIQIALATFGVKNTFDCARNPSASGCSTQFQMPEPRRN
jgi:TRAP-type C4-dicarboxylate transport system permease small subunit